MSCLTTLRYDPHRQKQVIIASIVAVSVVVLIIILAATLAPKGSSSNFTALANESVLCTDPSQRSKMDAAKGIPKLWDVTAGLGRAYNLMEGNPYVASTSDRLDPGYKMPIFDLSKKYCGKLTPDDRYQVPDHIIFAEDVKCSLQFKVNIINSSLDFVNVLKKTFTINSSNGEFNDLLAFTASTAYKQVKNATNDGYGHVAEAFAPCVVYLAQLNTSSNPPITDDFKAAVEKLPNDSIGSTFRKQLQTVYYNFFRDYGTHFVTTVAMGSIYGERLTMTAEQWWNLAQQALIGTNVSHAIEAVVKKRIIDIGQVAAFDFPKSDALLAKMYADNFVSRVQFSVGVPPPKNLRSEDWQNKAVEEPQPFTMEVTAITALLNSKNFPDDSKIDEKRKLLVKALSYYCSDIVKAVDACEPPKGRTVVPPVASGDAVSLLFAANGLKLGPPHLTDRIYGNNTLFRYAVFEPLGMLHTVTLANLQTARRPLRDGDVVLIQATWSPINTTDGQNVLTRAGYPENETFVSGIPNPLDMRSLKMASYENKAANGANQQWQIKKIGLNTTKSNETIIQPGDFVNFKNTAGGKDCWLQAFDATSILRAQSTGLDNFPKQPFLVVCGSPNPPPGWIIESKESASAPKVSFTSSSTTTTTPTPATTTTTATIP